jgi:hypothetical protein
VSRGPAHALDYPFPARQQDEKHVASMRHFTSDYLGRHGLFQDVARYTDTVVHFARFCTAPGTSHDGLTSSCMYMAWVLYLDDAGDGSVGEFSAEASRAWCEVARTGSVQPAAPGSERGARALCELVTVVRGIASRMALAFHEFTERLVAMMCAQQWERDRLASGNLSMSRDEYLRFRPDAIGNGAFVSIMKLDHGIDVERFDPLTRARAVLLDELTSRLVYLSNDILSEHREETDASAASMVRLLAQEGGIPWADAVVRATRQHALDLESYSRVRAELLDGHDADARRLAEICDVNVAGNLGAMRFIASRYRI